MILKSLELQGFKTFPDKTTLTFERGITSVVGPNGSGKSNISDAMRWVLGEQSVRTPALFQNGRRHFGGTPQRKAQGFAEVTLTIDNTDRRLPFDNDTVAVSRRYYRSGESEYLINKATVRLKDINELFMDTGLGRDGYSIIGQGKIDSIVAARSEDRREILKRRQEFHVTATEKRNRNAGFPELRKIWYACGIFFLSLRTGWSLCGFRQKKQSSLLPLTRKKKEWKSVFGWKLWRDPAGFCGSMRKNFPCPRPA